MPENARLNGCLDDIDLDCMARKATPQLFMNLGIQLHLASLSFEYCFYS
jgi:putative transposase